MSANPVALISSVCPFSVRSRGAELLIFAPRKTDNEKDSRTRRRGASRRSLKYIRARETTERINSGMMLNLSVSERASRAFCYEERAEVFRAVLFQLF